MAIKGKGRTKTRQPVRAPSRGPVPVPVPFAKRRGVQALAAFLAGLLVFWGGIWLTNGLREQDRTAQRRRAGAAAPPRRLRMEDLHRDPAGHDRHRPGGDPPRGPSRHRPCAHPNSPSAPPRPATETLRGAAVEAKTVSDEIGGYDLSGTITDKGFDRGEALRFLAARDELVTSLTLMRQAALLGVAAARLDGRTGPAC